MSWDDEDAVYEKHVNNPFAGEDEDDEVPDSWDAVVQPVKKKVEPVKKPVAPKSKILQKEQKEKEIKKNAPLKGLELEDFEKNAEYEMFKDSLEIKPKVVGIDDFQAKTKDDFEKLRQLIKTKFTPLETNSNYIVFAENIIRDLVANVEVDTLKKYSTILSTLANEKTKSLKTTGKKKKAVKGAKLATFRDNDVTNYDEEGLDFDDEF